MTSVTTTLTRYLLAIQQKPEEDQVLDNWTPQSTGTVYDLEEEEEPSYAVTYTEPEGDFFRPQPTQASWKEGVGQKTSESMAHLVSVVQAFSNQGSPFERFVANDSYWGNKWSDLITSEERNHLINALHTYSERLNLLHHYATQDGLAVNEDSEFGFWEFIRSVPSFFAGDLVLLDNGNLRVVWAGENNESHLGLQFLGNDMVQYVIFKQRPYSQVVSRVAGRDSYAGIRQQIRTFGMEESLEQV